MSEPQPQGYEALARYYELEYVDYDADLDFYLQLVRRTGGPFLDLACGTGRITDAVVQAGYEAVGIDESEAMLTFARNKLGPGAQLLRGDMRRFNLARQFPLIAVTLNSFMHLIEVDDQLACLESIRGHLTHDGRAVISTINPYSVSLHDLESKLIHEFTKWDPEAGSWVTKTSAREVDTAEQIEHVTYFYDEVKGGAVRRVVTNLDFRYTYRFELELLVRQAGLEAVDVYGTYDLDPYEITSPALIVVARLAGT